MCAHYKYVKGSLVGLVNISGGWKSQIEESVGVAKYLQEQLDKVVPKPAKILPEELEDIFPGGMAEILIVENGVRKIVPSAYGLIPPWVPKGRKKPSLLYNARDDSLKGLDIKPSFREAFFKRRCVASLRVIEENLGNYTWLEIRHSMPGQDFFIASLFNYPNHFATTNTHCLVTTEPNEKIAPFHDRMPVILRHEDVGIWLDPATPISVLLSLLRPCPVETIGSITERQDDPPKRRRRQEGFDFDE